MNLHLILYSRPQCCLCDDMLENIATLGEEFPHTIEVINIETSADLEKQYGEEIPVLLINGRKAFKYRASVDDLRARFKRRLQEEETLR